MSLGWILVWLPAIVLLAWFGNAVFTSELTGWRALSSTFTTQHPPVGTFLRENVIGISAGPGLVRALTRSQTRDFRILVDPNGLYLDAGSPGRFRWPALLIPWAQVRLTARRNLFGTESFELCLGSSVAYLTVLPRAFQQIAPFVTASTVQLTP